MQGAHGSIVVKALCYKLGFTQSLTEMSIKNIKIIMFLWSKVRLVRRADNFTAISEPIV
jgi:hypothetical protein